MPIPNSAAASFTAQAEPDSIDFDIISAAHNGTGVLSGCACTPASSGVTLGVAVAAGFITSAAPISVPVTAATVTPGAASGTNPRFDLVVSDAFGALSVVAGTAAASPVYPTVTAGSVVLCAVWIPTSATSITTANIVDKRQLVNYTAAPIGVGDSQSLGAEMRGFRAAWANRASAPVNILLLGDSNTVGYWASTDAQRWAQMFTASMYTAVGQPFSVGWQPHHSITNYVLSWTDTGAVTDNSKSGLGYGAVSLAATTGAIQATQRCDRVWVFYQKGTGVGSFTITIDGVLAATISATAGAIVGGNAWDSGPLTLGNHTVKIAANSATAPVFEGLQWFVNNGPSATTIGALTQANAATGTGIRVFNAAKFGSTALDFAAAAASGTWWTDNLGLINPHLVIMAWGTNDLGSAVVPNTYRTQLVTIIDRINTVMTAAGLPNPSILLCIPQGTGATAGAILPYATATYRAAADRTCAVMDRNALVGFIDTPANDPYNLGSSFDGTTARKHLSDTGMRVVGENTAELVLETVNVRSQALQESSLAGSITTLPADPRQEHIVDSDPFGQPAALRALRARWANRANKPVNIVVLGDSITQGYYANTFDGSIMGILMARLCQANGQAVPPGYVPASSNSASSYIGRQATLTNVTDSPNYGIGYGAGILAASGSGVALFSGTADRLWVHYPQAATGLGAFSISVDGGGAVTITPTGTPARGGRVWDSGPLTRGVHTVSITSTTATAAVVEGVTFFDGNGNSTGSLGTLTQANADTGAGLRLWNAAHFSFTANNYAVSPNGTNWWTDGFDMVNPSAVVIVLGVNDANSRTTQQYHDDLTTIISRVTSTVPTTNTQIAPSIIIVSPFGVGGTFDASPPYREVARRVAYEQGAAFIDWYALMGYVGTATADIYSLMSSIDGATKLHPSDIGHQLIGDNLSNFFTNAFGPTGQLIRSPTRKITTAGRQVADGVLNTTTTVTSATAAFVSANDVGKVVTAIGVPRGTTIASVTNGTTAVMSAAATMTASGVTLSLTTPVTAVTTGSDDAVLVDCTIARQALAIPAAAGVVGEELIFKKTDNTSNPLTLYTTGTTKIEGGTEYELRNWGACLGLRSNGTDWLTEFENRERTAGTLLDAGGEMSLPRSDHTTNTLTLTSGAICFSPFIAERSEAITKIRMRVGTVAAATVTLIRVGIYEVDPNGNLTMVASIPNTTTMMATINAASTTVNLSATWNKIEGRLYLPGVIFVGTTAPTVIGGGGTVFTSTATVNPYDLMPLAGALRRTGQTDLVTSITKANLAIASGTQAPLIEMLP